MFRHCQCDLPSKEAVFHCRQEEYEYYGLTWKGNDGARDITESKNAAERARLSARLCSLLPPATEISYNPCSPRLASSLGMEGGSLPRGVEEALGGSTGDSQSSSHGHPCRAWSPLGPSLGVLRGLQGGSCAVGNGTRVGSTLSTSCPGGCTSWQYSGLPSGSTLRDHSR